MKQRVLLAVSLLCAAPVARAESTTLDFDIPVRIASVGVTLLGIKLLLGSSPTKLRAAARYTVGAALTIVGTLGAVYGQDAAAAGAHAVTGGMKEMTESINDCASALHDATCKVYYDVRRNQTNDVKDHGWYFWYTGKNKFNRHVLSEKLKL